VRDRRVPLEMCPTSNVHTGVCDTIAEHPIGLLQAAAVPGHGQHRQPPHERHHPVREFAKLHEAFGWGWDDFEWLTINAMKSSFWPFDKRLRIINEQIKPGYAALRTSSLQPSGAER
jgi:adenosine deaminase